MGRNPNPAARIRLSAAVRGDDRPAGGSRAPQRSRGARKPNVRTLNAPPGRRSPALPRLDEATPAPHNAALFNGPPGPNSIPLPPSKMKHKSLFLLAVPALWAFTAPADRLAFDVQSGTSLTKTVTTEQEMSLDDMTVAMNGEEMDIASMMGGFEMDVSTVSETVVTDVYESTRDGRPEKLKRTFDTISNEHTMNASGMPMMGGEDINMSGSSDLEGMTVVFSWNEDSGEYDVVFDEDEEGDEELLEDLFEDIDLRSFLPEDGVSAGDTWEVGTDAMMNILAPGGNLKIIPDEMEELAGMNMPGNSLNPFDHLGDIDGSITAEYAGMRDGLAVIKLEIDVSTSNDMTEMMEEMMDEMEMPEEMPDMEMEYDAVDIEIEFEGSGELLWNVAGGHFQSFDVSGESVMAMDMAYSMSMAGQSMSMEMAMEMSGTQTVSMATSVSE